MSDTPWIKWYPADFLNGVADLSPHEIAVYTVVLCRIYDEDMAIPHDIQKIARRCNMRIPQCERAIKSLASEDKFILTDGVIDNKRAQKEREKRQQTRAKQSSNAHKRWHEGSEKPNENNDGAMPPQCQTDAKRMPTRSQKPEARNQIVSKGESAHAYREDVAHFQPNRKHYEIGEGERYTATEVNWLADGFKDFAIERKPAFKNLNLGFNKWLRSGISHGDIDQRRKSLEGQHGSTSFAEIAASVAARMAGAGQPDNGIPHGGGGYDGSAGGGGPITEASFSEGASEGAGNGGSPSVPTEDGHRGNGGEGGGVSGNAERDTSRHSPVRSQEGPTLKVVSSVG